MDARNQIGRAGLVILAALIGGCGSPPPRSPSPSQQGRVAPADDSPVAIAEALVGSPYRYGGASPRGFDCSGFVYYTYTRAGYIVPRTSTDQFQVSQAIHRERLMPGDLLFFRIEGKVSHVGIYAGNNRFIHAPSHGKQVGYATLDDRYWRQRLVKIGRLPEPVSRR